MGIVIFLGCKKDAKDTVKPTIELSSPQNSSFYSVPSSIQVKGEVSDNENIESVTIILKDNNGIQSTDIIHVSPQSKNYTINEVIFLEDIYLKSGTYELSISANDGNNTTIKFIDININEYPKKRKGVFLFSNDGNNTTITKLDSVFNNSFFQTLSGDFLNGTVNNLNQEVVSCGNISGDLVGMNILNGAINWSIANNYASQAHFTSCSQQDNEVYIGFYNRNIQSYMGNGTPNFSALTLLNFYSELNFVHQNNLLVSEQHHITTSEIRLVAYYMASGLEKQNMIINENIVQIFSYSTNELILFTNVGGNGKIKVYDIQQNSVWEPFSLSTGLISDGIEIDTGIYIIAQDGDLVLVNRNNFTKTTYLSGINAEKVKYDDINNQLFVTIGNTLKIYDYSSKTLIHTYNHSALIKDFDLWYNK